MDNHLAPCYEGRPPIGGGLIGNCIFFCLSLFLLLFLWKIDEVVVILQPKTKGNICIIP